MNKGRYIRILENPTYDMLMPIIREAYQTSHDRFGLEGFSHSGVYFTQEDFDVLQGDGAVWFGAYHYRELIGCLAFTAVDKKEFRLHKLAVVPSKRSSGLGRLLMMTAEKEAFSRGAKHIAIVCLANDDALVNFYQRLGYHLLKEKTYRFTTWRVAFMEKRIPHLVDQVGSNNLAFQLPVKACKSLPKKAFEIVLVYHPEEIIKQSNTGHVVQRNLPAHTKEIIWHRNTIEAKLSELSPDFETVLLYPSQEAIPLNHFCSRDLEESLSINGEAPCLNRASDKSANQKKLRLLVVDGTWQQAQKMMAQSPSLRALQHVKLVHVPKSQYILRKNQKPLGLCTLEAIAEAISELGYPEVKTHLMTAFFKWMAMGFERYGVHMGALDEDIIDPHESGFESE